MRIAKTVEYFPAKSAPYLAALLSLEDGRFEDIGETVAAVNPWAFSIPSCAIIVVTRVPATPENPSGWVIVAADSSNS